MRPSRPGGVPALAASIRRRPPWPSGSPRERSFVLSPRTGNPAMTDIVPGLPAPPRKLAFLLDIDGTILDIAATPGEVRVDDRLRDTLVRLDRLSGKALALVSGRSLQDIDRIFAPLRLAAIGGARGRGRGGHERTSHSRPPPSP